MLHTLVSVVHLIVAVFMILVVLIQGGNQGGVGAAFGGGNSSGVFGATGATSFFGKLTYAAAAIFMFTSISLTVMQSSGREGASLREKLEAGESAAPSSSAAGSAPAAGSSTGPEATKAP